MSQVGASTRSDVNWCSTSFAGFNAVSEVVDNTSILHLRRSLPDQTFPVLFTYYDNYVMVPGQVSLYFPDQSSLPTNDVSHFVFVFNCRLWCGYNLPLWGLYHLKICTAATLWSISMADIYASWCWFLVHSRSTPSRCISPLPCVGYLMLLMHLLTALLYSGVCKSPDPSAFKRWWRRVFLFKLGPSNDMVNCVGCQTWQFWYGDWLSVDNFTRTWSGENFVLFHLFIQGSWITFSFWTRMRLSHFPLEPRYEDFIF